MAATLDSSDFWQPYLPQMRREFSELTMDILIAGGDAGAGALLGGSVFVDWDVFNRSALAWLDMYLGSGQIPGLTQEGAYAWAWALNESTRRGVVSEIDRWVRAGSPLPELEMRLKSFFDDKRAHRVAVTEVTRIYAGGNVMAWQASGVVDGKRWQTARDDLVCPICSRLHNTFVDLNRGWEFSAAALEADPALKKALRAPLTIVLPPGHVGCRCWIQPVVLDALTDGERSAGRFDPTGGIIGQQISGGGQGDSSGRAFRVSSSPGRFAPAGTPVSGAFRIPESGETRAYIKRVLPIIDAVHGDGNLPTIPIRTRGNIRRRSQGQYRPGAGIDISELAHRPTWTIVHEIGHFLDDRGLPGRGYSSRRKTDLLNEWHTAVNDSHAIRQLRAAQANPRNYRVEIDGVANTPRKKHLNYLLDAREIWSRSYAQYIAVRSGDEFLLNAVTIDRGSLLYGNQQWSDNDFAPIARAIDNLFKGLGWLR